MSTFVTCRTAREKPHGPYPQWIPAGFWLRLFAYNIDLWLVVTPCIVVTLPLYGMTFGAAATIAPTLATNPAFVLGLIVVFLVIPPCLVFALFECSYLHGTPGKLLMGLCVVDGDGSQVSVVQSFVRNSLKIVSGVPLMLGYIMAGLTSSKQALHDILSDCLVMKDLNVSTERRLLVAFLSVVMAWILMAANVFVGRDFVDQVRRRAPYSLDHASFEVRSNPFMLENPILQWITRGR